MGRLKGGRRDCADRKNAASELVLREFTGWKREGGALLREEVRGHKKKKM